MADITMYGTTWCSDCSRSKAVLDTAGIAFDFVDIEQDAAAADTAKAIAGRTGTPVITFADGSFQQEPTDAELTAKLGELSLL